jgi:hypothetical protein
MTDLPEVIELGPEEEARRLWTRALKARKGADDIVSLSEALDFGVHAAEILVVYRLQPVKDQFPATIGLQLQLPVPEVDPQRDGVGVPKVLDFTDVIDILSGEDLACVAPSMHRGWEDRRFSCRRSRVAAQEAIGIALTADEQRDLLLLAAYRNRLFRCPPPVRVEPAAIDRAFPSLERVVEALLAD